MLRPPIDLSDEIAVRNYLQRLREQPVVLGTTSAHVPIANLYKLPVLTDAVLSAYVKDLVKTFDDNLNATVKEVYNALGDNIEQVYNLTSNLGENYATIDVIAGTYATQDEVGAIYGVNVEANGHVSGYRSIATGTTSVFQIYAEKFAISSSSTEEGYSPFQVDTVGHKINMTADVAIDGSLLVAGTITAAQIAAGTITADKIAANTITGNKIAATTIAGDRLIANTITATQIAAGTITAAQIAAGTITATQIAAGTITSSQMSTNVLLVGGKIESSNYSWNGGAPIGFGLYAAGDTVSGQAYNIIGGKIFGGQITGTTINASTINIRNLNLINDAGYTVDPFFTLSPSVETSGTDPKVYDFLTDMYTYNSTNASTKKTVGTTGTKVFISETDTTGIWAPTGYLAIAASDYAMTFDVDIMVGTTTLATRTTFSTNTDYDIGGFVFRYHYDATQTYSYTFCIKTSSNDISVASTSSSPIHISVSINWSTSWVFRTQGFSMLVSNI